MDRPAAPPEMPARSARSRRVGLAIAAVTLARIWFLQWHPTVHNPNEAIRVYLTRAIVEDRRFYVDHQLARFGDIGDKALFQGHTYSDKAPGLSFLGVVPFAIARAVSDLGLAGSRHLLWATLIALPS